MVANVTERDGVFTVRRPAWWDLDGSHVLPDYPTREEAKAIAHPWEPETEPLYRVVEKVVHEDYCEYPDECGCVKVKKAIERVEDYDLVKRSDDGFALGVKPKTRSLILNEEMYDIAEALQGEGTQVMYETGGSLKGGRKVWLLLRFAEPITVGGRHGTETIPYYALQNFHDGTGAFRGQATMVTIVCDNTAQMADLDARARGTEFVFRHTSNVHERIEEAKAALAGWQQSIEEFNHLSEVLLHEPITPQQRTRFVHEFIPMPQETLISDRVRTNVLNGRMRMLSIFDSPTQEGIKDTAWGLVQGAIEYSQWYRKAKTEESRFQRAYLDRSRLTADAVELAREVARA